MYNGDPSKLAVFCKTPAKNFAQTGGNHKKYAKKRGGGILTSPLEDKTNLLPNYYQLHATFETKDSMGANFINSCFLNNLLKH
jgi:hydroxymethylglutaryl-CoA reductase